jgi:hypothetical protein
MSDDSSDRSVATKLAREDFDVTPELWEHCVLEANERGVDVEVVLAEEIAALESLSRVKIDEARLEAAARRSKPPADLLNHDEKRPF